jgi:osmotically-inducible protein OsmY
MNKPLNALALAALLAGLLPGCAAVREYAQCGYQGCPQDVGISSEVRALLARHPALGPPNQIYVQTLDRVVYLTGQVATDLQRQTADSVAAEAAGVRRVVNSISLEYSGR